MCAKPWGLTFDKNFGNFLEFSKNFQKFPKFPKISKNFDNFQKFPKFPRNFPAPKFPEILAPPRRGLLGGTNQCVPTWICVYKKYKTRFFRNPKKVEFYPNLRPFPGRNPRKQAPKTRRGPPPKIPRPRNFPKFPEISRNFPAGGFGCTNRCVPTWICVYKKCKTRVFRLFRKVENRTFLTAFYGVNYRKYPRFSGSAGKFPEISRNFRPKKNVQNSENLGAKTNAYIRENTVHKKCTRGEIPIFRGPDFRRFSDRFPEQTIEKHPFLQKFPKFCKICKNLQKFAKIFFRGGNFGANLGPRETPRILGG